MAAVLVQLSHILSEKNEIFYLSGHVGGTKIQSRLYYYNVYSFTVVVAINCICGLSMTIVTHRAPLAGFIVLSRWHCCKILTLVNDLNFNVAYTSALQERCVMFATLTPYFFN